MIEVAINIILFYFILPILLVYAILFIFKVRKQCKKYGTKTVFRMSHVGKKIEIEDYVFMMLKEIPGYHVIQKWEESILFMNPSGIYLFYCFDEIGMIAGNYTDNILTCSMGKTEKKVPNPLIRLHQFTEQLQEQLGTEIKNYLVVNNHCQFLIKENRVQTIFLKNVYYDMIQNREKKYTEEQMKQYHQKIKALSNSVNPSTIA